MNAAPKWATRLRRPRSALAIVAVAAVVVGIALVVAVRGLLANPVRSTDSTGIATLTGTFFPYQCGRDGCRGYVQAGGRSVFVVFPTSCQPPAARSEISVRALRAPDLGSGSYTAVQCASGG